MAAAAASRRLPGAVVQLRACRARPRPHAAPLSADEPPERTCFVPDEVRRTMLELEVEAGRACRALSRHFTTPAALAEADAGLARIEARAKAARRALKRR